MILQALKEYYDRKAADPESDIAPEGFERKEIHFLVVIKPDGEFVSLEDTREINGKRLVGKVFMLPRSRTRSGAKSYETTFLLWDHAGYLFQLSKTNEQRDKEKAANQHKAWIESLHSLPDDLKKDAGVAAILLFYTKNGSDAVRSASNWGECVKLPSCNMTFRLAGDDVPVPCRPEVQRYARNSIGQGAESEDENTATERTGRCLVSGEYGQIARTHGRTSINKDTKSLVSFQKNSGYDSYGKEQCYNAPVCKSVEFAYTTALNTLLKSRSQRLQVADATTVFWSEKNSEFEKAMPLFFSDPPKDDPNKDSDAVKSLYESIWNGAYIVPKVATRFYVLGLSPNSARISVRFWHVGTVQEVGARLKQHVTDLSIIHPLGANPALPLWKLLRATAVREEDKNIPPNLAGDTARSVLEGMLYPATLLHAAVLRVRAEHEVSYPRAALIKACINRKTRHEEPNIKEELKVSLDTNNMNIGYRLGRLFAALEKIQSDAQGSPSATIRDRFYGAASGTPATVFGTLMRLKNHHLAKLPDGLRITRERQLGEIMSGITDFPPHLKLEDQGRFAIGYYHQMQDFYTRKEKQD
jgi:CRISPR-associated protein Csd1